MRTTKGVGGAVEAGQPTSGAAPSPVETPAAGSISAADSSAKATMQAFLDNYGLGSLGGWAWEQYLNGTSVDQIMLDLRSRPEYVARFPAMAALALQNRAISEAEYVEYERSAVEMFAAAGLPASFADNPDDFTAYLTGNVALPELQKRIFLGQQAALTAPKSVRDELVGMYGIEDSIGALTAFWLDPAKARPLLEQQFTSAQIAAQAKGTGFGALSVSQAERLAQLGVTDDAARTGLGSLAGLGQVGTETLAGEVSLSRDELLDAAFAGDATAAAKIRARQEQRTAAFGQGGGFTQSRTGQTGVGSAT